MYLVKLSVQRSCDKILYHHQNYYLVKDLNGMEKINC